MPFFVPLIKLAVSIIFMVFPFLKSWIRVGGGFMAALLFTLNPLNIFNWIVLGLTTFMLMMINPFGIFKEEDKFFKRFGKAFLYSLLMLIPLFFLYYFLFKDIIINLALEVAA